jgi:PBP1b-binding outer membrane lipoprotein LpoB
MKLGANLAAALVVAASALALTGCATENDERDAMGSQLAQPPAGTRRPPPIEAGDIALVGQDVANAILQLPPIAQATTPPLVRFNGVTSIINPPIDTAPYTQLLRDRLLLLTREKLRFVEHTLPPYVPGGHKKHVETSSDDSDAQYQVLAEMRGQVKAPTYKIQVEFVEIGSGNILFNQTYRISKESDAQADMGQYSDPMAAPQPQPQQAGSAPPQNNSGSSPDTGDPNKPPPGYYDPKPATNNGTGNTGGGYNIL